MKTNKKVKEFSKMLDSTVNSAKKQIDESVIKHLESFKTIDFTAFSNENKYEGELKNKVFFVYHNHYWANSGTWMSVGELMHAHTNYEDRGYIKGVATDLDGYVKILRASKIQNEIGYYSSFFIRKSKHSDEYKAQTNSLELQAKKEVKEYSELKIKEMSEQLRLITGCSLLYYVRYI